LGLIIARASGLGLLFILWLQNESLAGFFLLLALALLSLLRWRYPQLRTSILLDVLLVVLVLPFWPAAVWALVLLAFEGLYLRVYAVALALPLALFATAGGFGTSYAVGSADIATGAISALNISFAALVTTAGLAGLFLSLWQDELQQKMRLRDKQAGKYYELEELQNEIAATLPHIERSIAITERSRIARDLHDNAGHEIVAAYISLQTARTMLGDSVRHDTNIAVDTLSDALELYDAALQRLDKGVNKVRETAHNLQSVNSVGAEDLQQICVDFPVCPVDFKMYGDGAQVPVYIWNTLESVVNEGLTNAARHACPDRVIVEIDITDHLVRLLMENDGVASGDFKIGSGLRNLRRRAATIGGNLSVDAAKDNFRIVCTIPIKREEYETVSR
jgi:signal transduction histidine kinase